LRDRAAFDVPFADGDVWRLGRTTRVMGVLNVTPDSFSDGGSHSAPDIALTRAAAMVEEGVDVIDVGGESTRPGAAEVSTAEEADRVLPVIAAIKREFSVRVSIDTMKADVARQAIQAGADLVNDVSALRDSAMAEVVRRAEVPLVLMHMRGSPRTMQDDTRYESVLDSVGDFLGECVGSAIAAGVGGDKILVDPGIGFGKSPAGSMTILRGLPALRRVGCPILVGASRKAFIGAALGLPVSERLEGSLAVAAYAASQGAHVVRAHDVAATVRAVRMIDAIRHSEESEDSA